MKGNTVKSTTLLVGSLVAAVLMTASTLSGASEVAKPAAKPPVAEAKKEAKVAAPAPANPDAKAKEGSFKTYTSDELKKMVGLGRPPLESEPVSKTVDMAFGECEARVKAIGQKLDGSYPFQVMAQTDETVLAKVWTSDGTMMMNCSRTKKTLTTTATTYK